MSHPASDLQRQEHPHPHPGPHHHQQQQQPSSPQPRSLLSVGREGEAAASVPTSAERPRLPPAASGGGGDGGSSEGWHLSGSGGGSCSSDGAGTSAFMTTADLCDNTNIGVLPPLPPLPFSPSNVAHGALAPLLCRTAGGVGGVGSGDVALSAAARALTDMASAAGSGGGVSLAVAAGGCLSSNGHFGGRAANRHKHHQHEHQNQTSVRQVQPQLQQQQQGQQLLSLHRQQHFSPFLTPQQPPQLQHPAAASVSPPSCQPPQPHQVQPGLQPQVQQQPQPHLIYQPEDAFDPRVGWDSAAVWGFIGRRFPAALAPDSAVSVGGTAEGDGGGGNAAGWAAPGPALAAAPRPPTPTPTPSAQRVVAADDLRRYWSPFLPSPEAQQQQQQDFPMENQRSPLPRAQPQQPPAVRLQQQQHPSADPEGPSSPSPRGRQRAVHRSTAFRQGRPILAGEPLDSPPALCPPADLPVDGGGGGCDAAAATAIGAALLPKDAAHGSSSAAPRHARLLGRQPPQPQAAARVGAGPGDTIRLAGGIGGGGVSGASGNIELDDERIEGARRGSGDGGDGGGGSSSGYATDAALSSSGSRSPSASGLYDTFATLQRYNRRNRHQQRLLQPQQELQLLHGAVSPRQRHRRSNRHCLSQVAVNQVAARGGAGSRNGEMGAEARPMGHNRKPARGHGGQPPLALALGAAVAATPMDTDNVPDDPMDVTDATNDRQSLPEPPPGASPTGRAAATTADGRGRRPDGGGGLSGYSSWRQRWLPHFPGEAVVPSLLPGLLQLPPPPLTAGRSGASPHGRRRRTPGTDGPTDDATGTAGRGGGGSSYPCHKRSRHSGPLSTQSPVAAGGADRATGSAIASAAAAAVSTGALARHIRALRLDTHPSLPPPPLPPPLSSLWLQQHSPQQQLPLLQPTAVAVPGLGLQYGSQPVVFRQPPAAAKAAAAVAATARTAAAHNSFFAAASLLPTALQGVRSCAPTTAARGGNCGGSDLSPGGAPAGRNSMSRKPPAGAQRLTEAPPPLLRQPPSVPPPSLSLVAAEAETASQRGMTLEGGPGRRTPEAAVPPAAATAAATTAAATAAAAAAASRNAMAAVASRNALEAALIYGNPPPLPPEYGGTVQLQQLESAREHRALEQQLQLRAYHQQQQQQQLGPDPAQHQRQQQQRHAAKAADAERIPEAAGSAGGARPSSPPCPCDLPAALLGPIPPTEILDSELLPSLAERRSDSIQPVGTRRKLRPLMAVVASPAGPGAGDDMQETAGSG